MIILLTLIMAILVPGCSSIPKEQKALPEKRSKAVDYSARGEKYFSEGNYQEALLLFSNALAQQVLADNREGIIGSYYNIGRSHLEMGSLDEAEDAFLEGLRLAEEDTIIPELAKGIILLGELSLKKGSFEEGERAFLKALRLLEGVEKGDDTLLRQKAVALHDLGVARKQLRNMKEAEEAFILSLEINRKLEALEEEANNHYMLSSLHFARGRHGEALEQIEEALSIDRSLERSLSIAEDLFAKGSILEVMGELDGAYTSFGQSFMIYQTLGMSGAAISTLERLAGVSGTMGDTEKEKKYRKALETLKGESQ